MASIQVRKKDGSQNGTVELADSIFNARVNKRLLDDVVRLYANNKRSGTSSTKTFAEVRGGGKRPWRQKGTGRARSSSNRNPLWRGGGIIFGPKPRTILYQIPKKIRLKAIISALSSKVQNEQLLVLDDVKLERAKTKEFAEIIQALDLEDSSVLCVVKDKDDAISRASRNIPKVSVKSAKEFNAYHIMRKKTIVIEKSALPSIEERLKEIV